MRKFIKDESGMVTVDWFVIAAGIVGLGIAVMIVITPITVDYGTELGNTVAAQAAGEE